MIWLTNKRFIYCSQIDGTLRDGGGKFIWSHSYSKVHQILKDKEYDTNGQFLNFASLNVENRPRVKCVSAKEGKTSFGNLCPAKA